MQWKKVIYKAFTGHVSSYTCSVCHSCTMSYLMSLLKGTKNNGRVFWIQHCIQSGERPGFNSRPFMLFCLLLSVAVLLLFNFFCLLFLFLSCSFLFLGVFWFSFFFIFFFSLNSRHQAGKG